MGTLLSERSKNLIYWSLFGSIVLACAVLIFINSRQFSVSGIQVKIRSNLDAVENSIGKEIDTLKNRGDWLCERFLSKKLEHAELYNDEAVVLEKSGVVQEYFGQIYYFKLQALPEQTWKLLQKNQDVYFIYCCKKNIYFITFFFKMDENKFLHQIKYPFLDIELKFFDAGLPAEDDQFQFDKVREMFFYSRQ